MLRTFMFVVNPSSSCRTFCTRQRKQSIIVAGRTCRYQM